MKNAIGKILLTSLLILIVGYSIFVVQIFVYFRAFVILLIGISMMFLTFFLINLKLAKTDSIKYFVIRFLVILGTYFFIGNFLWLSLLSLIDINILKINNPESLTRFIPTIGPGLIFFYKFFGYMQNFDLPKKLRREFPFIPLDIGELKIILRDLIVGSVFVSFLIIGLTEEPLKKLYDNLWSDAMLTALIVSPIFAFLEVYTWLFTIQYKEECKEEWINLQRRNSSRENNIKYKIKFFETLKKSERLKQIYSYIDKRKRTKPAHKNLPTTK